MLSYNTGTLTVLSNHVGDVSLHMAVAWMLNFGSWNYVYYLDFLKGSFEIDLISLFIILAPSLSSRIAKASSCDHCN
jgi:NADH-ubiquinone oxidoreductase chain 5